MGAFLLAYLLLAYRAKNDSLTNIDMVLLLQFDMIKDEVGITKIISTKDKIKSKGV